MNAPLAIARFSACPTCSTDRAVYWHRGPCPVSGAIAAPFLGSAKDTARGVAA